MQDILSYRESFRDLDGGVPAWVRRLREEGLERFSALGFPTTRMEDWKYTSVAPIAAASFRLSPHTSPGRAVREAVGGVRFRCGVEMVFVNGRFAPELSSVASAPAGVRLLSLREAFEREADLVKAHLGRCASAEESFTALNSAFLEDGALVHLSRGADLGEAPIHLIFVSRENGEAPISCPRILVIAEESSRMVLVESHLGSGCYFTNPVTEIVVGRNSAVEHIKVQQDDEAAFHVATIAARQEVSSRFASCSISLGAALARNDIRAVLDAEGAECGFDGLYMIGGRQHVDHHTTIDHRKPRGTSRELYKGVLDGRSTGVFNGKVYVRPDAQKSDAQQVNKNLLLSEAATINTKPELQILADDVKCSHGATIGRLDDNALYYLRSRGIDEPTARELLIRAFANELVGRIRVEPLRARLEERLAARWEGSRRLEAT